MAGYKGCLADFVASGEVLPEASGFERHGRDGVSATVEGVRVGVGNANFVSATVGGGRHAARAQQEEYEEEEAELPPRMRAALRRKREKERAEAAAAAAATSSHAGGDAEAAAGGGAESAAEASIRLAKEATSGWGDGGSVLYVTVDGR